LTTEWAKQSAENKKYVNALKALVAPGLYAADLETSALVELPVVALHAGPEATPNAKARHFIRIFEGVITERLVKNDRRAAEILFALDDWAGVPARDRRIAVAKLRDKNWTWESSYRKEPLERDLMMILRALVREEAAEYPVNVAPAESPESPEEHSDFSPICYATKFAMPEVYRFWNDLCITAERRFYLAGGTNKSWFGKSSEQSQALGQAMTRILVGGGQVKIISRSDQVVVAQTKNFFERFVFDPARQGGQGAAIEKSITEQRLVYATVSHSNYDAVVSDDRIVLLPIPNTPSFRNEAMVLEWTLDGGYHPFMNYLADMDRTVSEAQAIAFDALAASQ
jgi:hypothetical protein